VSKRRKLCVMIRHRSGPVRELDFTDALDTVVGKPPQADSALLHDRQRQPRQGLPPCRRQFDVLGYRLG